MSQLACTEMHDNHTLGMKEENDVFCMKKEWLQFGMCHRMSMYLVLSSSNTKSKPNTKETQNKTH